MRRRALGPSARDVTSHHYRKCSRAPPPFVHCLAKMADGENKRADAGDAAEPLLKRARLRDARGDSEHGAAGDTEPVEAEPEPALMDESHPQASLNNNNNNNLTEPEPEPEPEPELSGTGLRSSRSYFYDLITGYFGSF